MPPPKSASSRRTEAAASTPRQKSTPASQFAFSFTAAFSVFALVNTLAALWSPIQDCDETFNYWEPTHYLIHGYGRQTWEYSPEYAIRDWTYIALHAVVAKVASFALWPISLLPTELDSVHELIDGGKIAEFYGLRVSLGIMAALCQAKFTKAISRTLNPRVAIFTGMVMTSSTGLFHAAPAYLPSSFAMSMGMLGAAAFMDWKMGVDRTGWFTHGSNAGIMWFGLGAVIGWPFAGALVLPFMAEEIIIAYFSQDFVDMVRRWVDGVVRALVAVSFQLSINWFFYRKLVIVPMNIVLYNVFGGEGRGPDIFGTEAADFYIRNLFLNFNLWLLLALAAGPLLVVHWIFARQNQSKLTLLRSMFFVIPFYLWLGIFSAQAHKEERFMYPAYPFLALNAAIAFHTILVFIGNADPRTLMGKIPAQLKLLVVGSIVLAAINLGIFRTIGMITAYRAPMTIYNKLHRPGVVHPGDTICFGKEWYRFPSSFFLPNDSHAKFIRSDFDGLLPGEFRESVIGFGLYPGTWMVPGGMNDRNEYDPGKVMSIRGCRHLVDSYTPGNSGSELEPNYVINGDWDIVTCSEFLDSGNTHILGRLLWLPDHEFIPEQFKRKWSKFCLLRHKDLL